MTPDFCYPEGFKWTDLPVGFKWTDLPVDFLYCWFPVLQATNFLMAVVDQLIHKAGSRKRVDTQGWQ